MKRTLVLVAALLSGCATQYKQEGFGGGFTDTQLNANTFRVAVRGNGVSRPDRIEEMALLRSSELALQHGFKYFVIVDGRNTESVSYAQAPAYASTTTTGFGTPTLQSNTVVSGGEIYRVSKPSTSNTVVCLNEQPAGVLAYDAKIVFDSLSAKYRK